MRSILVSLLLPLTLHAANTPNIIVIFADDMGVGDLSHTTGKAATPHIDRLAKEGLRFTDAHTTSSVCTPSRYGLLTGRYNWRTRLQNHVFNTPTEKPLIKAGEATLASLLQKNGYHTACVGKWHLGFDWQLKEGGADQPRKKGAGWEIDYTKEAVTPTANGFDYFFGILASLDMPPYVYVENKKAIELPTVVKAFRRPGAATADFEAYKCLGDFAEKSVAFIDRHQEATPEKPFFLYLPLTSPHTPIVPSEKWKGKSSIGAYGDFLMETDWVVGQVLEALDKHGLSEDTLVIFSTDNGCSPAANIGGLVKKGHKPNGDLRGHKADIYEGGHRVPFIARWPKKVPANTETTRLTTTADLYATFAEIVSAETAPQEGVDSVSFLSTLHDPSVETLQTRSAIVMHSIGGYFAIREGNWKLCFCGGSGGWSQPLKAPEGAPKWQLFNLQEDPAEETNLYLENPEKVKALHLLMKSYIAEGRSTPGAAQQNDAEIILEKPPLESKKRKKAPAKKKAAKTAK